MSENELQTVAVVIPYFQRDPLCLRRCLDSVFAQRVEGGLRFLVIIVDDASPLPLAEALSGIVVPRGHEVVCLARFNGGPGAARNTALEYLMGRDIDFVAFIDSDDIWRGDHIANALAVLAHDADFFFCDHDRWNDPLSYLASSETFQRWLGSPKAPFLPITNGASAIPSYQFEPGQAFCALIEDYLAQTSTVVYRFDRHRSHRFDPSLRYAGEDNMFWLQLSKTARAVRFTTEKDVATGEGINMFASSIGWSHPDAARRAAAIIKYFVKVGRTFKLDALSRASLTLRRRQFEAEFTQIWIRKFWRAPAEALLILMPLLWMSPLLALELPTQLIFSLKKISAHS